MSEIFLHKWLDNSEKYTTGHSAEEHKILLIYAIVEAAFLR